MTVAREGFRSVNPRLFVTEVEAQIAFLRTVFDATGDYRPGFPAEMRIGDSTIMVSEVLDSGPNGVARESFPGFLYIYVGNADATYERAVSAGAISLEPPMDTPYGDRRAMIGDRFGNVYQIAHVQDDNRLD